MHKECVAPDGWNEAVQEFRNIDPYVLRAARLFGVPSLAVSKAMMDFAKASMYVEMYHAPLTELTVKKRTEMKEHKAPQTSPRTAEEQAEFDRNKHEHQMRTLLADALAENKPLQVYSTTKQQWLDLQPQDSFNLKNKYRIKHKWQAEQDAFKDGEDIQYRPSPYDKWKDVNSPAWFTSGSSEYRVKPKPKTLYAYVFTGSPDGLQGNSRIVLSQDEPTSSKIKEYTSGSHCTFYNNELQYLHVVDIYGVK